VFPPLDGSEWVQGDARVLANIVLHGVSGELVVKGQTYKGSMPSFRQLSDEELAAVLTHLRGQWSNKAEPIAAALIRQERQAGSRSAPFNGGQELRALARTP
ncbi:MAG: cytochrome c, partial [Aquabacterium sp.]|nr:cytochrome c [Aquabacterium sp.]